MKPSNPADSDKLHTPFPLQRYFYARVIPAIVLFMAVLSIILWFAFNHVTRSIYFEEALQRADLIVDSLEDVAPKAWTNLQSGTATDAQMTQLREIFAEEIERQKLIKLKVYDLRGTVIYSFNPTQIGTLETGEPFRQAIVTGYPTLVEKADPSGTVIYEIYTPYLGSDGQMQVVFELYETVGYLNSLLYKTAVPAIAVPIILQIVLILILGVLVGKAQNDINNRTKKIGQLTDRLKTFVSDSAMSAALNAHHNEDIPSQNITCTLFHSDVRDFTSYADANTPERVVYFLNDLMSIQVGIVTEFGGDVDKMIGDALLVRFQGENAEQRAVAAAQKILDQVKCTSMARGLGIGIFTGPVISGAIGPTERRDFTVIGDSVNMSARLCAHAHVGEIVVDTDTCSASHMDGFGDVEAIQVKGKMDSLNIQRWHI
ncbi:MAG: adenylate/guanylate cyclase domain-containing protein [Magnetovibrio sp.]|nr:adenylate/guanylate cyclase domain-containing protein [Magnetovibrio sp.]